MQRAPGKTVYYLDKDVEYYFYDTGSPRTKLYLSDAVEVVLDDSAPRQVHYKVFDRLGSLLATTDLSGQEQPADGHTFDAFGGPRAANGFPSGDKLHPVSDHGTVTNNGFTGHEHLDDVFLIHMNGRVYDYRLGRFLSMDPIISNPASSQSINPYSYIGNNPLSGTDPTGYFEERITGSRLSSTAFSKTEVTWYDPPDERTIHNGAERIGGKRPDQTAPATDHGSPARASWQSVVQKYALSGIAERTERSAIYRKHLDAVGAVTDVLPYSIISQYLNTPAEALDLARFGEGAAEFSLSEGPLRWNYLAKDLGRGGSLTLTPLAWEHHWQAPRRLQGVVAAWWTTPYAHRRRLVGEEHR